MGDIGSSNGTTVPDPSSLPVLFFIPGSKVQETLSELIDTYISNQLSISKTEAITLHAKYFHQYGQTIEGLIRHHEINALHYNSLVDDALPLETLLKPNPELKTFLNSIDRSKVRLRCLTNAYITHARRVLKILGIEAFFEDVTYVDYGVLPFICKPQAGMFGKAMVEAGLGVGDVEKCFFVDDSVGNCVGAREFGWNAVHLVEGGKSSSEFDSQARIQRLEELVGIWPDFFK
ncbi:uncharacterized protein N7469_003576 [Penicillium citrinum]|uniref:Uncharacterized protein n=1 Tax=Penicillium citrinum TaxID=5077 RepID=A0A9W9P2Z5_PENCI|nr:uncharacterized protein N7469_003576 [Penicillium citrinum]KAJ5234408.1 hypothetical protein N7469_003576 [Penicillium citrinum]KAK5801065.1 hypothetical protein VI817_003277 [Penicillium citrinum]